jgi:hypothetical protein
MNSPERQAIIDAWRYIESQGKKPSTRCAFRIARGIGFKFRDDEGYKLLLKFREAAQPQTRNILEPNAQKSGSENPSRGNHSPRNPEANGKQTGSKLAAASRARTTHTVTDTRNVAVKKNGEEERVPNQDRIDAIIAAGVDSGTAANEEIKTSAKGDAWFEAYLSQLHYFVANPPAGVDNIFRLATSNANKGINVPAAPSAKRIEASGKLREIVLQPIDLGTPEQQRVAKERFRAVGAQLFGGTES